MRSTEASATRVHATHGHHPRPRDTAGRPGPVIARHYTAGERGDAALADEAEAAGHVTVRDEGAARWLTLCRPRLRNALSTGMYLSLTRQLRAAAVDARVNVVVLTGQGPYYSSGNDLSSLADPREVAARAETAAAMLEDFVDAFISLPKPLIAAVNGPALGIAVSTLGLCDVVYASESATFATPFTALGQSPEGCASHTFPAAFGAARANEVIMFGRSLNAAEACEWGLVSAVFPADSFGPEVARRVAAAAALPRDSLRHTKALVRDAGAVRLLRQVNAAECHRLRERWPSAECHDAIAAFFERQKRRARASKAAASADTATATTTAAAAKGARAGGEDASTGTPRSRL